MINFIKSVPNKIIEDIKVIKLNLKAGIAECVSQNKETYPSGIETLNNSKTVLFNVSVTDESNPEIGKTPESINNCDGFLEHKKSVVTKKSGNKFPPTNHKTAITKTTGLIQACEKPPNKYLMINIVKNTVTIGKVSGINIPVKIPCKIEIIKELYSTCLKTFLTIISARTEPKTEKKTTSKAEKLFVKNNIKICTNKSKIIFKVSTPIDSVL